MKGEKIFIAHDKTMRKKNYGFASEERKTSVLLIGSRLVNDLFH